MIKVTAVGVSLGVFLAGVGAAALIFTRKTLQQLDDAHIWEMSD